MLLDVWMSVWSVQLSLDLVDLSVQLVQLVAELLKRIPKLGTRQMLNYLKFNLNTNNKVVRGLEPWSSGYGRRLML